MLNRRQVTNGCSGGCCEKFTLPCSIIDIIRMKDEHENARKENRIAKEVIMQNGVTRLVRESELDKLIDMLIPLGESTMSPQYEQPLSEVWKEHKERYGAFIQKNHEHFIIRDNEINSFIFTCKYYGIENKICTNYENRPNLCQQYGKGCAYKGCGFDNVKKLEEELRWKNYEADKIANPQKYFMSSEENEDACA